MKRLFTTNDNRIKINNLSFVRADKGLIKINNLDYYSNKICNGYSMEWGCVFKLKNNFRSFTKKAIS